VYPNVNAIACTIDGERVAVAAVGYHHQGLQIGKVWVLSGWGALAHIEAELIPPIYNDLMRFGSALAFNEEGNLLFVGARADFVPGRVFVYRLHGRSWVQEWEASSANYSDWLGYSLAVDATGDVLAVGAPRRDNPGPFEERGAVVVYRRQGSSWVMEATITPAQLPQAKDIGNRVALSRDGTVLALSSQAFSNTPVPSGAVYVLERFGGTWAQVARLQEPVAYSWGGFSTALAMDSEANILAVGNFQDSRIAYHQGAVSIFRKGSSGWAYDTVILPANPVAGVGFGTSVSINAAGDRLRVGATGTFLGTIRAGAVEEFEFSGGAWQRAAVHFSPTPEENAALGMYVVQGTATGNRWLATEPWSDAYATDAGQVHFFEASCLTPTVYCTAQPNTLGCVPQIGWQGTPSASKPTGFEITLANSRNQRTGILFYGTTSPHAQPWSGGTLCVQPPLRRTPLQMSGGNPPPADDCSGTFSFDFNAWYPNDPALFAGARVFAQYLSRDPSPTSLVNLSDALDFYVEP
jgi:hypothetical protein